MASTLETPRLLEKQIDRLYGLQLEEFVRSRDELATGLKASGEREGAARVRALEKPTVPAWTVNQIARRNPRELRALFSAVDKVREAQAAALTDGPSRKLREAADAEKAALSALSEAASEILAEGERRRVGVVDRVTATLRAGALDPESRRLLKAGRLTRELQPPGFDKIAELLPHHPGRRREDKAARDRAARERVQRLEAELRELKLAVRAAEGRVREAEREAERMHREAEEARGDLGRAEAELEAARAEL